ncbi:unnamed protein product [Discosporangium mesarthrocarpum]
MGSVRARARAKARARVPHPPSALARCELTNHSQPAFALLHKVLQMLQSPTNQRSQALPFSLFDWAMIFGRWPLAEAGSLAEAGGEGRDTMGFIEGDRSDEEEDEEESFRSGSLRSYTSGKSRSGGGIYPDPDRNPDPDPDPKAEVGPEAFEGDPNSDRLLNRAAARKALLNDLHDNQLKLVAAVLAGPDLVKRAVQPNACLLGQKANLQFFHGEHYLEVDIDLGSSVDTSQLASLCRVHAKHLVVDLGLVLQGGEEGEPPEILLGALRLNHFDLQDPKRQCPLWEKEYQR